MEVKCIGWKIVVWCLFGCSAWNTTSGWAHHPMKKPPDWVVVVISQMFLNLLPILGSGIPCLTTLPFQDAAPTIMDSGDILV